MDRLYRIFLSENSKRAIEKIILYIALVSFFAHLALFYLSDLGVLDVSSDSEFLESPISAIYTPFSFILIYEVYLLIYYLPRSFTTYITKQYEIITLIIIRKLFKDLSTLELTTNWFEVKDDLQFTYDIIASLVLFYLIFLFQKNGRRITGGQTENRPAIQRFIKRKKIIATILVPLFLFLQ